MNSDCGFDLMNTLICIHVLERSNKANYLINLFFDENVKSSFF